MKTSKVKIKAGILGPEEVVVDGEDITEKVVGVTFRSADKNVNEVWIELAPELDVESEAVVKVSNQIDTREIMGTFVEWLERVDPGELEQSALGLYGMNEDGPYAEKVLQVLINMVKSGVE